MVPFAKVSRAPGGRPGTWASSEPLQTRQAAKGARQPLAGSPQPGPALAPCSVGFLQAPFSALCVNESPVLEPGCGGLSHRGVWQEIGQEAKLESNNAQEECGYQPRPSRVQSGVSHPHCKPLVSHLRRGGRLEGLPDPAVSVSLLAGIQPQIVRQVATSGQLN